MMRKSVLLILLFAVSTGAMALGLGNIELNSGLNQPFDARIELLSPTASELDSLNVALANIDAFDRAGIERPFILSSLRFEVLQSETGQDYIHVTSRETLREPFLNFLLEASWSNGRLFREYTVLLDPPLYDPNVRRSAPAETSAQQTSSASINSTGSAGSQQSSEPGQFVSSFSGNEVGPTVTNDTLWAVANRVRPDSSVSVNQMMIALLRANPEAFIGNNINGLKQGQILRVPALDEITTTTYEAAIAEVSSQNAMWEELRGTIATNTLDRPLSTSVEPVQQNPVNPVAEGGSELRLLAAGNQNTDTGQTAAGVVSNTNSDASLELMNEQLESMTSENADLRDRLSESETIIEDLKRLIELKDDELATMQQQIGGGSTVVETESAGVDTGTTEIEPADGQEGVEQETEMVADDTATSTGAEAAEAEPSSEPEQEAVVEEVVTEEATPEPVVQTEAEIPPEQSILDQIIGFITGNLIMVGAVIGGLILLAMVVAFIRKRKTSEYESELAPPTEFPDFESSAGGPENDGPQIEIESDNKPAKLTAAVSPVPVIAKADIPVEVAPAQHEVADEDPLAEVNVFLAYEHFDQAEEFVREAISRQPNNLDFHSKLLEVFYSAGDKPRYEAEAKVLYGLVNGSGPHWDMATIMWQEMSPNRPLFAEPAEGEDDSKADITGGRGIVDLTADNSEDDDAGLDFDLGMAEESVPAKQSAGGDDVLDITSGSDEVLDVTASESSQKGDEDILDVTAAVGLDSIQAESGDDNYSLDMPAGDDKDILDFSAAGSDDPLDVTAHADLEAEGSEDLLDMSATGSGLGKRSDSNALDFDIGSIPSDTVTGGEENLEFAGTDENMIDFDTQAVSSGDDGGIELDFSSGESTDDGSLDLSMDSDSQDDDGGIKLDFGSDSASGTDDSGLELSMDSDSNEGGLELDFSDVEDASSSAAALDMESTVKIPKSSVPSFEDDDDDEGDHTVFVPRSKDTSEQSAEDENATKLDLAKAYVELGEKIKAKSILEEVIAEGNYSQRLQAKELMAQIV